ncbi:MAG: hypothetical protein H6867_04735 [Rhodospirillales bacterium]|nr:hypothetical protein [Rhodospirillales bacterium]MCB9994807.1 hypothetical protein [Rhodospirillales bacterium]
MKYLIEFLRTILPQGLAKVRINRLWAFLGLLIGSGHTWGVVALLTAGKLSENVALPMLDYSLGLTVILCVAGAFIPNGPNKE